jgi:hypothetical protein
MSKWVRQVHRWLSVVFVLAIVVNLIALGQEEPAAWVYISALLPLFLLLISGLYLFALPYTSKWRGRHAG